MNTRTVPMLSVRTCGWVMLAAGLAGSVHLREARAPEQAGFVSTRSAARRIFVQPNGSSATALAATVTLRRPDGEVIVIRPHTDGTHTVEHDGSLVGPADPRAVDGLWSSLRLATTLRAVSDASQVAAGTAGTIEIAFESGTASVALGARTPDGVGRYARINNPSFSAASADAQAQDEVWVVEHELTEIIDQDVRAWVARRVAVLEPGHAQAINVGQLRMARGEDGRWRSASAPAALLDTDVVDARMGRLLGARLAPLVPGTTSKPFAPPWAQIFATGARQWELSVAGSCPDGSTRRLITRGPGWAGCLDSGVLEQWEQPREDVVAALLERRFVPYRFDDILRVEQREPSEHVLRSQVGNWRVVERANEGELASSAVRSWMEQVARAEVELAPADTPQPSWWVDVTFVHDSSQRLRVRCAEPPRNPQATQRRICQRDDGPLLQLRTPVELATDSQTFMPRELFTLATHDVRALEIVDDARPRQSVHFDLGVWRLDAPEHPEGDVALSDVYLEQLLAALSSVVVTRFQPRPEGPAERTLEIEQVARRGRTSRLRVELWEGDDGCVVAVDQRAGTLAPDACERLRGDLLHDDPLAFWLETARSIELSLEGQHTRLVRDADSGMLVAQGHPHGLDLLRTRANRAGVLCRGRPAEAVGQTVRLRVQPRVGAPFVATVDDRAIALERYDWHYELD